MTQVKNAVKANCKLHVQKVKRTWCVMAGVARLGGFKTEEAAKASLENDRDFYEYWSKCASVTSQNTPARVIVID